MEISREYRGEEQQFIFLIQDNFSITSYSARTVARTASTNLGRECIRYSFVITKLISGQCKNT